MTFSGIYITRKGLPIIVEDNYCQEFDISYDVIGNATNSIDGVRLSDFDIYNHPRESSDNYQKAIREIQERALKLEVKKNGNSPI